MLLNSNKLPLSKRFINCMIDSGSLHPKIIKSKDATTSVLIRKYSDDTVEDPFKFLTENKWDNVERLKYYSSESLSNNRKPFFSEQTKDKIGPFGLTESDANVTSVEEENTKSNSKRDTFHLKADSTIKSSLELTRQVKLVFGLVKWDMNAIEANSILSVIKHLNLILSAKDWEQEEKNEFMLSEQYGYIVGGIVLFYKGMDPYSLLEVVKFLTLLGLSYKNDSVLRLVYENMRDKSLDPFAKAPSHCDLSDNKEMKIIGGAALSIAIENFTKRARRKKGKCFSIEHLRKKLENAAKNSLPHSEMMQVLKVASTIKCRDMTPSFLINYFEVLDKIHPTDSEKHRNAHPEKIQKITLKHALYDCIRHLLKTQKEECRTLLPRLFLVYAKVVADGKYPSCRKTEELMLFESNNHDMSVDQHFITLRALNILKMPDVHYLYDVIIKNIAGNPEVLEGSIENFEEFLEALLLTDFKHNQKWPFVESLIQDLAILKNEETLKHLERDRLVNIAANLTELGICPLFLLQLTQDILKSYKMEKENTNEPEHEKGTTNNIEEEINENDGNDATSNAIYDQENDRINMFEILEDSHMDSFSDDRIFGILSAASLTSLENITPTFLMNYYKLLVKISRAHPRLKEVGLHDKLYDWLTRHCFQKNEFIKQIPSFLPNYARAVAQNKEKFCKKLVDDTVEKLMKEEEITVEEHFSALYSLNIMKTFNMAYLQHIVSYILQDSKFIEGSVHHFLTFTEALAASDFPSQNKNQWPFLKCFINDSPILNNEDLWSNTESRFSDLVNIIKNLALFGIYSDPLLSYVSNNIKNVNPNELWRMWDKLLVLNQAIDTLHPSFKQPFLTEETLAYIERCHHGKAIKLVKLKSFAEDVKANLESENNDIILTNCHTKSGLKIDLVLALNEMNRPFSFQSFLRRPKKFFIDDISTSLPDVYQLMFLCLFLKEDCLRDTSQLKPKSQLKLKIFEAMGYIAIPILKSEWDSVENDEKRSYFWKKITETNSCNIPEDMVERAREPVFID